MSTIPSRMGSANSTMSGRRTASKTSQYANPLHELQKVHSKFHLHCRDCGVRVMFRDFKSNIDEWFCPKDDGDNQDLPGLTTASCPACRTLTCMGCGRQPHKNNTNTTIASETLKVCCERGRLLCIWLILCRFDDKELELQVKASQASAMIPKAPKTAKDTGVGYDTRYENYFDQPRPANQPINKEAMKTLAASDNQMLATLVLLSRLLANQVKTSALPDTQDELILFRASLLLDRVCALIRNDSILDLSQRSDLYYPLFSFLEIIAHDPRLAQVLFEPQPSRKNSPGLRTFSEGSSNHQRNFNVDGDQLSSIFACFGLTYRQANVFLDVSKNIKPSRSKLGSGPDPTDMCKTIVKLYSVLEGTAAQIDSSSFPLREVRDPWTEFSEQNRVTFTDDVLKNHRYMKVFPSLKNSSRDRMLVIGREISTMTTSLPAGVFVKVAESRADVMKVLIIGVEGSPYAGGIFIFDLLLPQNYPNSPPKMSFVLEGADSEIPSMNPNLHPGGLVCLSILNTWSGDESQVWQPRKSTLLAVLVSVQAMILGAPLPWLNEPGLSMLGETPQANEHKLKIQLKTVKHAMITWLKKIKMPGANTEPDVWQDIVEVYWQYNHKNVRDTVEKWSLENPHIKDYDKIAVQYLGVWMGGMEVPPPPPINPAKRTKGEDLAQTLDGLIFMEKIKDKHSKSVDPYIMKLRGTINSATVPIEGTSISKSSSEGSTAATTKDSTKDKRKDSVDNTEHKKDIKKGGSKRQKTENTDPSDGYDSDFEDGSNHTLNESLQEKSPHHPFNSFEDPDLQSFGTFGDKWVYTGSRKFKEVKAVCLEFGIKPARTIVLSIENLENHVNENVDLNADLALKYGDIQNPFN